jgi:hypothetical protein
LLLGIVVIRVRQRLGIPSQGVAHLRCGMWARQALLEKLQPPLVAVG